MVQTNPVCACGCGESVRSGRFLWGHNSRLGVWNKGKPLPGWVRRKLSKAASARRDSPETREVKRLAQVKRWAKVSKDDRSRNLTAARAAFAALPKAVRREKLRKSWMALINRPIEVLRAQMERNASRSRLRPSPSEIRFLDLVEKIVGRRVFRQVRINRFSLDGLVGDVNIERDGD